MSDGRDFTYRDLDGQRVDWGDWDSVHRPRLRVVKPEPEPPEPAAEPSDSTSEPIAAPDPVLPPPSGPRGLGPIPPGKVASEGVWVGGVWQERPPVDPVRGIRAYIAAIRNVLDREEDQP